MELKIKNNIIIIFFFKQLFIYMVDSTINQ